MATIEWKASEPPTEIIQDVCARLLNGEGTTAISRSYDRSDAWSWQVATTHGLSYDRKTKKWTRKQDAMSNGEWNLTQEDYDALLTPERERTNGNEHGEAHPVEAAAIGEMSSLDDDIQEALDLLARAEQQRKADIKTIEQLQRQQADSDRITANISDKVDQLRSEKRELENRVLQLETENKRLMDKLKGEISRGLLRQGMDSLRKVL